MLDNKIDKIILGDSISLLKDMPDNSVDMTFADPPFNLKKKYNASKDNLAIEEYIAWCEEWITEMVRITKPTGSIFVHNIPKWLAHYTGALNRHAQFKHWIAWNAATAPMGKSLQPAHYGILFYVKDIKQAKIYELRSPHERERKSDYLRKDYGGKKNLLHPFGSLVSDVWNDIHRIKHAKYRNEHPCQLPLPLLERLILMTTDEGDIVLDPFMGTGTTAVAAKKLGRHYIGFDISPDYKKIAEQNIAQVDADSKIGKWWVSFYLGQVKTIRDKDWQELQPYFDIPETPEEIDYTKITLRRGQHILRQNKSIIEKTSSNLFSN